MLALYFAWTSRRQGIPHVSMLSLSLQLVLPAAWITQRDGCPGCPPGLIQRLIPGPLPAEPEGPLSPPDAPLASLRSCCMNRPVLRTLSQKHRELEPPRMCRTRGQKNSGKATATVPSNGALRNCACSLSTALDQPTITQDPCWCLLNICWRILHPVCSGSF